MVITLTNITLFVCMVYRWWMKDEARIKFLNNFDKRIKTYKSIDLIRLNELNKPSGVSFEHHAHMDHAGIVGNYVIQHFESDLNDRYNSKQLVAML